MKIPTFLLRRLQTWADRTMASRPPDFTIAPTGEAYVKRWWVIPRNRWFNIYLHHFLKSDDDRALHDHPWVNVSMLLRGNYIEVLPCYGLFWERGHWVTQYDHENPHGRRRWRKGQYVNYQSNRAFMRHEGHVYFRRPKQAHRVELMKCIKFTGSVLDNTLVGTPAGEASVVTLFITGPKVREWGFLCPQDWRHWREFTNVIEGEAKGSEIGKGCA